jgi:hypothetical protein
LGYLKICYNIKKHNQTKVVFDEAKNIRHTLIGISTR